MLVYSINFDVTICTFIQGIAHYLFNPAVATLRKIDDSSISTSFYSLTGVKFEEDVLVESILLEVCPIYCLYSCMIICYFAICMCRHSIYWYTLVIRGHNYSLVVVNVEHTSLVFSMTKLHAHCTCRFQLCFFYTCSQVGTPLTWCLLAVLLGIYCLLHHRKATCTAPVFVTTITPTS